MVRDKKSQHGWQSSHKSLMHFSCYKKNQLTFILFQTALSGADSTALSVLLLHHSCKLLSMKPLKSLYNCSSVQKKNIKHPDPGPVRPHESLQSLFCPLKRHKSLKSSVVAVRLHGQTRRLNIGSVLRQSSCSERHRMKGWCPHWSIRGHRKEVLWSGMNWDEVR